MNAPASPLTSIEHIGNFVYILTFVVVALIVLGGHARGKIDLWDLVTATDRTGKRRTDGRKLAEMGAFFVMTVSFYFLTITGKMSEWYAGLYAAAWVGARAWRDFAQIKHDQVKRQGDQ